MEASEYDDISMFYPEQMDELVMAASQSVHATYRTKINQLEAQLLLYRMALIDAGIEPPDAGGEDLVRIMELIQALTVASTDFVQFFGSGREMWSDRSWRGPN